MLRHSRPAGRERTWWRFTPEAVPACRDGVDNDGDGDIDYPSDSGCTDYRDEFEEPQCSDGIENEWDGLIDYPDDPDCASPLGVTEAPPFQIICGLGAELALLLPPLIWVWRRRSLRQKPTPTGAPKRPNPIVVGVSLASLDAIAEVAVACALHEGLAAAELHCGSGNLCHVGIAIAEQHGADLGLAQSLE